MLPARSVGRGGPRGVAEWLVRPENQQAFCPGDTRIPPRYRVVEAHNRVRDDFDFSPVKMGNPAWTESSLPIASASTSPKRQAYFAEAAALGATAGSQTGNRQPFPASACVAAGAAVPSHAGMFRETQ